MASLRRFQDHLAQLYGLDLEHDVDDFLITSAELARHLDRSENPRDIEEKLLVVQEEDDLALSLFVDGSVVDRLGDDDPHQTLHDGNLNDYCTALEGVSHFLYLVWNAGRERSVRQIELEMQAEVDKYLAVNDLLARQQRPTPAAGLHRWLFHAPRFDLRLNPDERVRYFDANYYAARYCYQLEQRYLRPPLRRGDDLCDEIRDFYRLPFQQKIHRIENPRRLH